MPSKRASQRGPGERASRPWSHAKHSSAKPYVGVNLHKNTGNFESSFWYGNFPEARANRRKGKQFYLGSWDTPAEAARAHDLMAINVYGRSANLNFDESTYDVEFIVAQPFDTFLAVVKRQAMLRGLRGDTGYRGVTHPSHGSRGYEARFKEDTRSNAFLGRFETAKEAARAYDRAVLARHGKVYTLNFPGDVDPRIVEAEPHVVRMLDVPMLAAGSREPADPPREPSSGETTDACDGEDGVLIYEQPPWWPFPV